MQQAKMEELNEAFNHPGQCYKGESKTREGVRPAPPSASGVPWSGVRGVSRRERCLTVEEAPHSRLRSFLRRCGKREVEGGVENTGKRQSGTSCFQGSRLPLEAGLRRGT